MAISARGSTTFPARFIILTVMISGWRSYWAAKPISWGIGRIDMPKICPANIDRARFDRANSQRRRRGIFVERQLGRTSGPVGAEYAAPDGARTSLQRDTTKM